MISQVFVFSFTGLSPTNPVERALLSSSENRVMLCGFRSFVGYALCNLAHSSIDPVQGS
ncbi:hypothetical protein HN51_020048, partial [Arachis hypogaea]